MKQVLGKGNFDEYTVRAMSDIAFYLVSTKFNDQEPLRKRIEFLFSSFHSLGAIIAAIGFGILSCIIWVAWRCTTAFIGFILSGNPESFLLAFGLSRLVVIPWFALWIGTAFILWRSWNHRKNLAIKEESIFISSMKSEILDIIQEYWHTISK